MILPRLNGMSRRSLWIGLGVLCGFILVPAARAATVIDEGAKRWGIHPPASTYGYRFDELFSLITILLGTSFVIMMILLLLPVLRHTAGSGHKAHYDHGTSLHDKRFTAITSVVVFIILDAWILIISVTDLREAFYNVPRGEESAYRVEVLAQQWSWNFRATGADDTFGTGDDIITINKLTVPQNRPVVFNLASKDVIHSLFLPEMRLKRDVNPGAVNEVWFEPTTAGTYDILCAELCGFAHYQMGAKLHVLSSDTFDAWEKEASLIAQAAYDDSDTEAFWAWDWKE